MAFSLHVPTGELTPEQLDNNHVRHRQRERTGCRLGMGRSFETTYEGVVPNLERRHKETDSDFIRRDIERFMQEKPCHACKGLRLKPEVLAITVGEQSIMDVCQLSIDDALGLVQWPETERQRSQDCRDDSQRNLCPAAVPARRRPELSELVAQRHHPERRRSPAHPPGHPDWLRADGRAVRAWTSRASACTSAIMTG